MENMNDTVRSNSNKKLRDGLSDIEKHREDEILDMICNICNKELHSADADGNEETHETDITKNNKFLTHALKNKNR